MSRLTVVTPTLGESPFLAETVQSVAALGPVACHVLVAPERCTGVLERRYPGIRVIGESTRGGMYAAIRQAVEACVIGDDDFVTWINDDDRLCAGGVLRALRQEGQTGVQVLYGKVDLMDRHGKLLAWIPVSRCENDLLPLLVRGIMPLAQPGTLVRGRAWRRLGGVDGSMRFAGDLDLVARALCVRMPFRFIGDHVASFRLHAGQLSKDEAARAEAATVYRRLQGTAEPASWRAVCRFRWSNFAAYVGRVRRFGFRRMEDIYQHE